MERLLPGQLSIATANIAVAGIVLFRLGWRKNEELGNARMRNTAHIRKRSKKAKSEKRRETVTFPMGLGLGLGLGPPG